MFLLLKSDGKSNRVASKFPGHCNSISPLQDPLRDTEYIQTPQHSTNTEQLIWPVLALSLSLYCLIWPYHVNSYDWLAGWETNHMKLFRWLILLMWFPVWISMLSPLSFETFKGYGLSCIIILYNKIYKDKMEHLMLCYSPEKCAWLEPPYFSNFLFPLSLTGSHCLPRVHMINMNVCALASALCLSLGALLNSPSSFGT